MKLLLTSGGLSTSDIEKAFLQLLIKPPEENQAIIMGVRNTADQDFDGYIQRNVQMLVKQGLKGQNIQSYRLDNPNPPSLDDTDVLLVLGGNEYRYMKWIREQGLYSDICKLIERDGVYVGRSAGSIIMGPTVDLDYWSAASNDVGLEDLAGFGFVDFVTVSHVDSFDRAVKVREFHKETEHKMVYLTNQQAVLVIDDMYRII
jgi:dipeptidase E